MTVGWWAERLGVVDSVTPDTSVGLGSLNALDTELARLARLSGSLRLGLAEGLEALARIGGHHELGFASVEAYALERCERSARWVQESRALARRLRELGGVRRALVSGEINLSMAQIVTKVARTEDEELWLSLARQRTVRAMRQLVREVAAVPGQMSAVVEDEKVALAVTVDHEDGWFLECARMTVKRLGGGTLEETLEALLAEGMTTLLPMTDRPRVAPFEDETDDRAAQRSWEKELAHHREEAERCCEAALGNRDPMGINAEPREHDDPGTSPEADWTGGAASIDRELRRVSAELARRDLLLGEAAEAFWHGDGWRRLGYATESQYARERLGMSLSSVKAKRALARRSKPLSGLREAVMTRKVGFEAARLVSVVATPATAEAWVGRARERTVKHLREEVDAVQMLGRLGIETTRRPPDEGTMKEIAALESRVVTGELFDSVGTGQMSALGHELLEHHGLGDAGAGRSLGRRVLRFRVSGDVARLFRWLERLFHRYGPRDVSFVRFLCNALIDTWKHALRPQGAYADVYSRDGYRCANPVCGRRDVTPHHLVFRAAGGDDSSENVVSLCLWCHLEGVHAGRLAVGAPASDMHWRIGRSAHTIVTGRVRLQAPVQA
jgi:hypothetical protein